MVSPRMRRYGTHLQFLKTASPTVAKSVIKNADGGLVQCLCEGSLNILKGNVRLTAAQKRKLARHKRDLRTLAQNRGTLKSKKRILQKGGFLSALIGPLALLAGRTLLPMITGAIGRSLSK